MTLGEGVEVDVVEAGALVGLGQLVCEGVEVGEATIVPQGTPPLDGVSVPAVAAEVSYTDGASGGNLFVTTITGVRKLAAAMGVPGLPVTVILNREGAEIGRLMGGADWNSPSARAILRYLLALP